MPLLTKANGKFSNAKSNILKDIKIVKEEEPKQNIISNTPETPQHPPPQTQATNKPNSAILPELSFTKKKKLKKIYFKVD